MASAPDGRKLLGLIITDGIVEYLKNDKPIHINAEEMGIPKFECNEIVIFYYPTEKEAYKAFKEKGFITDETTIFRDDRNPTKQ